MHACVCVFACVVRGRYIKKSIETEAVFIKTEMNNEWDVNFLQNSLLDTYSCKFPLVKAPQKFLFWYGVKVPDFISFNVNHILKSYSWDEFSIYKIRKSHTELDLVLHLHNSVFCKKTFFKMYWDWWSKIIKNWC